MLRANVSFVIQLVTGRLARNVCRSSCSMNSVMIHNSVLLRLANAAQEGIHAPDYSSIALNNVGVPEAVENFYPPLKFLQFSHLGVDLSIVVVFGEVKRLDDNHLAGPLRPHCLVHSPAAVSVGKAPGTHSDFLSELNRFRVH